MIFYNIAQNTPEWLELRKGKITASCIKDLRTKEARKKVINRIIYERITGCLIENYSSAAMERGHEMEGIARESYENQTFTSVQNGGFFELSEFIGCSPDGVVNDGIIEIKCPLEVKSIEYLIDRKLPKEYEDQVFSQLYVTKKDWCDFVSFFPGLPLLIVRVLPDQSKFSEIESLILSAIEEIEVKIRKIKKQYKI